MTLADKQIRVLDRSTTGTLVTGDRYVANVSAAITGTLDAGPVSGGIVEINIIEVGDVLTIDGNGNTIDGSATQAINTAGFTKLTQANEVLLRFNGTEWNLYFKPNTLLNLFDGPNSYAGEALKNFRVRNDEQGFEFFIPQTQLPGFPYNYVAPTAMSDPGAGNIRFNNATPASVTQLAIHLEDNTGVPNTDLPLAAAGDAIGVFDASGNFYIWNIDGINEQGTPPNVWFLIDVSGLQDTGTISVGQVQVVIGAPGAVASFDGLVDTPANKTGRAKRITRVNDAATALDYAEGEMDAGNNKIVTLADATADQDALNRRTGDARYLQQANATVGYQTAVFSPGTVTTQDDRYEILRGNQGAISQHHQAGHCMVTFISTGGNCTYHIHFTIDYNSAGLCVSYSARGSITFNAVGVTWDGTNGRWAITVNARETGSNISTMRIGWVSPFDPGQYVAQGLTPLGTGYLGNYATVGTDNSDRFTVNGRISHFGPGSDNNHSATKGYHDAGTIFTPQFPPDPPVQDPNFDDPWRWLLEP